MEQEWQNDAGALTAQAIPQKDVEQACFHALGLVGRNCEYLEQHLARVGADEQTRQAVNDISAAAARLDRTMNEVMTLLDFLRAEEPPQLSPLDLCQMLQQIAAQADMVQEQLNVELTLDYGGLMSCRVMADCSDAELLCLHLLSNALRACGTGGKVQLTLDYGGLMSCRVMADCSDAELLCLHLLSNALRACGTGGKVQLTLRRCESFWKLTVLDDGCGLPETSREAWLENRRCFLGGAGLGLLLCRECCRRMGWDLRVEQRAPEKGTRAVVTIPLCDEPMPEPTVELRSDCSPVRTQQQYQLRNMLVRELRIMPERGGTEDL